MKKSNFISLLFGTISLVLFALGMCMALLPEWNAFNQGIVFGLVGIIIGLITIIVWRKMEQKAPIKFNKRIVGLTVYTVFGALILGVGMCLCMVWESFVIGTLIGLAGILMLLSLIPIIKGIK